MKDTKEFLIALGKKKQGRQEDLEAIKAVVAADLHPLIDDFGGEDVLQGVTTWLLALARQEPPAEGIEGLRFGLFEGLDGANLYLSGAMAAEGEAAGWASSRDYYPEGRYANLEPLVSAFIYLSPFSVNNRLLILAISMVLVKAFFREHMAEFKELTGLGNFRVAIGFDEDDFYELCV